MEEDDVEDDSVVASTALSSPGGQRLRRHRRVGDEWKMTTWPLGKTGRDTLIGGLAREEGGGASPISGSKGF